MSQFNVGDQVDHIKHGRGEVTWVYRSGAMQVEFIGSDGPVEVAAQDMRLVGQNLIRRPQDWKERAQKVIDEYRADGLGGDRG